ncbi:MAG: IS110 family RNA-guided transposase [Flavisolibacter sp.]
MKEVRCFIGIDVSKLWFDLSLMKVSNGVKEGMLTERFDNNTAGFKVLIKWLKAQGVPFNETTLVVIENTGVYHRLIWEFCTEQGFPLHIGNAAGIKWSLGITRGKDDVTDSQRLCNYCYRHADELRVSPTLDPMILHLKDLMTSRARLIKQVNSTKVYLKELKSSNGKEVQKIMERAHKDALEGMKKSLLLIEAQIKKVIKEHEAISKNYKLLKSVPGIGHVTALYLIGCTANFSSRISGKQLASYAGVVPFVNTSGTSIKGKARVHKMANKDLKRLLHMGARSVANHNPEFKQYYERKLKEGKHDLSIINAIRNKIVLRAVSVINKQTEYVNNYTNVV